MSSPFHKRALLACSTLALVFTGFSGRLVHLQVAEHDRYVAEAADNHGLRNVIPSRRGAITDVHGQPLAQNEPVKTVVADGSLIRDHAALATLLAGPLGIKAPALEEKLRRQVFSKREGRDVPAQYIVLKKSVPENVAGPLRDLLGKESIRAITFEQDSVRVYPNGDLLCHVLGYTNNTNEGVDGVESTMNDFLHGHDGFRYTERDRKGKEIVAYRGQERAPRNGCNVRLTVDMGLQMIVEDELADAVKQYSPRSAVVVLLQPHTGEILAMANRPHYDLNAIDSNPKTEASRRNRAIADSFEPGSTYKIVPMGAALQQRLVRPDTMVRCENGSFHYMGRVLNDTHPYPELSVHDVLVHSSNIGAAKLGLQLGEQRMFEYMRRFGFGERTGIALPGEIRGTVHAPHRWNKISITRVTMGQEVAATCLQIAASMAVIANGGKLMIPQIVRDVADEQGNIVAAFPPVEVRRVLSEEVAGQVRNALVDVTGKKGTAKGAAVPGFHVAGKTGTAQRALPAEEGGGYERGKYVVSFVGFMPANDPKFVCLVLLDDARTQAGLNYGGLVAAPVFKKIATRAARYLNLEPDPALLESAKLLTQNKDGGND